MAKFLAARSKVEARPGQGSKKPARIMRTLDPLAATSVECDALVCTLPADCSKPARARLLKALRAAAPPPYHLVTLEYAQLKADAELSALLLRSPGALFVVPASGGQLLCCGGSGLRQDVAYKRCCAAVIEHAKICLLYTSPSPRDVEESRMPSSA